MHLVFQMIGNHFEQPDMRFYQFRLNIYRISSHVWVLPLARVMILFINAIVFVYSDMLNIVIILGPGYHTVEEAEKRSNLHTAQNPDSFISPEGSRAQLATISQVE